MPGGLRGARQVLGGSAPLAPDQPPGGRLGQQDRGVSWRTLLAGLQARPLPTARKPLLSPRPALPLLQTVCGASGLPAKG